MGSFPKAPLKLIALDEDDLKVISAHLQDAVIRMADMAYVPGEHRFAAILNRFDWLSAVEGEGDPAALHRCRCALRFERVKRAQVLNIRPGETTEFAELLAVTYEESEPPGGFITLYFAGGGALRLHVECIEAEMRDLGAAWKTAIKPEHALGDAEPGSPAAELVRDSS
ncbi:DUF2948 family protein [Rhodomicrobium vannielii ATCC 17100]|uniref:DUF2948 family protein n=1 Tax=Rhodomicrobium vannielii TaxID=1069 RepID=UPI00191871B8|nr:DUF2948 family protein [Rhodomicrobium vannielii]MBJ7534482.1 DUF2948 family protein [Rhodomicrobium vannielii ATCC 17100]